MLGRGSALGSLPALPGVAGLSVLPPFSDFEGLGLSDLTPAKLFSNAGKSWLTAQASSAIHSGFADFFDFVALPAAFGGICGW